MKRLAVTALFVALVGLIGTAQAQDKPNPTGTWKWTTSFGGQDREQTLKLKLDGDKLTGSMPGRDNQERQIEEATYKNGEISFKVTRERNGQKTTSKYTGKVVGDTIEGKTESNFGGENRVREWKAKRSN
jgi:hypothetical protein